MAIDEVVERFFCEICLEGGMADEAQLERCRKIQEDLAAEGIERRIGEIMMDEGLLSKPQALKVLKQAHKKRGDKPRIGGFEILDKIGEGGMGIVYRARQASMDRMVALKLLPRRLSKDPRFVERFLREARTSARLNHRNVVTAIDVGEAQGYHYFAMELIDGETFEDVLERRGKIPENELLPLAVQVVDGLHHAAEIGITHRDIKPANIMFCKDGSIKIADMGLAIVGDTGGEGEGDSGSITGHDKRAGTPHYMAPEQVEGNRDLDFRTDEYALGASLFELVTGKRPFDGANAQAIMAKRLYEDPPVACEVDNKVSRGFAAVLLKMMQRDPANRYQDSATLIADLEAVAARRKPSCMDLVPGKSRARRRRRKPANVYLTGLVLMLVLAAACVALFVMLNPAVLERPSHPGGAVWDGPPPPVSFEKAEDGWRLWIAARDLHHRLESSGESDNALREQVIKAYLDLLETAPHSSYAARAKLRLERLRK